MEAYEEEELFEIFKAAQQFSFHPASQCKTQGKGLEIRKKQILSQRQLLLSRLKVLEKEHETLSQEDGSQQLSAFGDIYSQRHHITRSIDTKAKKNKSQKVNSQLSSQQQTQQPPNPFKVVEVKIIKPVRERLKKTDELNDEDVVALGKAMGLKSKNIKQVRKQLAHISNYLQSGIVPQNYQKGLRQRR